jgi:hypothetical protein
MLPVVLGGILVIAFGGALFARRQLAEGEEIYEADDDLDEVD